MRGYQLHEVIIDEESDISWREKPIMQEFTVQVLRGQTVAFIAKVNADNAEEALLLVADQIAPEPEIPAKKNEPSIEWLFTQVGELKERVTFLELSIKGESWKSHISSTKPENSSTDAGNGPGT